MEGQAVDDDPEYLDVMLVEGEADTRSNVRREAALQRWKPAGIKSPYWR